MTNCFTYRVIVIGLWFIAFPALLFANEPETSNSNGSIVNSLEVEVSVLQDSIPRVKPKDKKPEEVKPEVNRPDIKEVPKSRRQLRPRMVTDRIKVKPPRIPRPKIIKRPLLRLTR